MKKLKVPPVIIILGIILIIGGVVFVWKYAKKESLLGIEFEKRTEESLKDSDNDGLKDWEEELFHTDLLNPDTDGDGYLDGEEVDSGHNPLVKAPGDKLTFYPMPLGEKYNITQKVLSDEIIDALLDSYTLQKAEYIEDHSEIYSPETFSASIKESTIQEMSLRAWVDIYPILLEKAEQTISEMPEIFEIEVTDEDIRISEDNSLQAIKSYLAQISSFLNSDVFFLQEQAFQALISAFENNNFSQLDELIKINDAKIEKAKEIIVPSTWKEIHKQGLELTLLIRNIFVSFRDSPDDPFKAQMAYPEFENFVDAWNNLMKKAINLAKKQGVKLSL